MFKAEEKNNNLRLPSGFRDIFPLESSERNKIKKIIGHLFKSWGYGEVKTPVMEYTENISIGVGSDWKNKLINFIDIDGSLISLRADMTIPIARLAGMRIKENQLPARFCYFCDAFRQTGSQVGNKRVYSQAGLEFLGSRKRLEGDLEVLTIFIRVLRALGLDNFRIGQGHIGFIDGLFNWLKLDDGGRKELKKYIVNKDFVRIEDFLKKIDSKKAKIFMEFMHPENDIKKISGIVSSIGEESLSGVFDYLNELYLRLEEQGYGKYLIFDFSIIRDFDYYTGLLFEVYSREITEIIGSGGRYDGLIRKFGTDMPATGFALDIDILHGALGDSNLIDDKKIMLSCPSGSNSGTGLIRLADRIRDLNINVEILFDDIKGRRELALNKNCRFLAETSADFTNIKVIDLENGSSNLKSMDLFLKELGKWKKN
ncbi:MAG TPA: hypothetical protein DCP02_06895 [Actinobacteria bacterium]|nr:hypothetical protein [Actinomycetota bacterium]